MKTLISAIALAATPLIAQAEGVTLTSPLTAQTFEAGNVDVSVYYTDKSTGYEVTAVYVALGQAETPAVLTMALQDGDRSVFGLPGQSGRVFRFERVGSVVNVDSAQTQSSLLAMR